MTSDILFKRVAMNVAVMAMTNGIVANPTTTLMAV